jgi:type II secretory pathway component PulF
MNFGFPTFRAFLQPWQSTAAQHRSLLRLIAVATEQNLPLAPLVVAWADDESGFQYKRLLRLARLLHEGVPLADAVEQVPRVLGEEDVLAIRFGSQSGTLAATLRERLASGDLALGRIASPLRKTCIYVAALLVVSTLVVSFVQIKIVPELNKIMQEFRIENSPFLHWSVWITSIMRGYWFLFILVGIAALWLAFLPWPGRPFRRRLMGPLYRPFRELHFADVLDKLSVAVTAGRPIAGAISTLARYHFDPALRTRLLFVRNEMEQGVGVWESMAAVGLLSPPETRALETSEVIGNRAWVLQQLARVKKRRITARLSRLADLVLPAVILTIGAFVLFQALSVFVPLVDIVYSTL